MDKRIVLRHVRDAHAAMAELSPIYKKLMTIDVEAMSLVSLSNYCHTFIEGLPYVRSIFIQKTTGVDFTELPLITDRLKLMVTRFEERVTTETPGTLVQAYKRLYKCPTSPTLLRAFKMCCNAAAPLVTQKHGAVVGNQFTVSTIALYKLYELLGEDIEVINDDYSPPVRTVQRRSQRIARKYPRRSARKKEGELH
jgi:hypothetical protein